MGHVHVDLQCKHTGGVEVYRVLTFDKNLKPHRSHIKQDMCFNWKKRIINQ